MIAKSKKALKLVASQRLDGCSKIHALNVIEGPALSFVEGVPL